MTLTVVGAHFLLSFWENRELKNEKKSRQHNVISMVCTLVDHSSQTISA